MAVERHTPRFAGLFIPARLIGAPDLNILDKVLLAQLEATSRRRGYCSATNAQFAQRFGIREATIVQSLAKLDEHSLIAVSVSDDNMRAIRLTADARRYWHPDIEGGDDSGPISGDDGNSEVSISSANKSAGGDNQVSRAGAHADLCSPYSRAVTEDGLPATYAEVMIEEPVGRVNAGFCDDENDSYADSSSQPLAPATTAPTEYEIHAREDEELRAVMAMTGIPRDRAAEAVRTARENGRVHTWVRGWIAYANDHAANPAGYAYREIMANKELPHTLVSGDDESEIRNALKGIGTSVAQIEDLVQTVRENGRARSWVVGWIAEGRRRAKNVPGYVASMIRANNDLPKADNVPARDPSGGDPYAREISPERRKQINLQYEAMHKESLAEGAGFRETRDREMSLSEQQRLEKWERDKEESGFNAIRETLRAQIAAGKAAAPRLTEMSAEEKAQFCKARADLERFHNERKARFGGEA